MRVLCCVLGALLLLSCTDKEAFKPVAPPSVDLQARELARFAGKALSLAAMACHAPAEAKAPLSVIDFQYTDEFMGNPSLHDFVDRFPVHYQDLLDSCFYPETTQWGGHFPFYWGPGDNYIPDTLMFHAWADSVKAVRPAILRLADSAREMDSTVRAFITYLGRFTEFGNPDSFMTRRFAFRLYPKNDPCDSIEGALSTGQSVRLMAGVPPDSGVFQRTWYFNPARSRALDGLASYAGAGVLHRLSVYARFSKGPSGTRVDSLARIYYYTSDTVAASTCDGRIRVASNAGLLVRGTALSDSTFADTLANGSVLLGRRSVGGLFTLGDLLNSLGDTLLSMGLDPAGDTVRMRYLPAVASGDSAAFAVQGQGLSLIQRSGDWEFSASLTSGYGLLQMDFTGTNSSTGGDPYAGEITLNLLTGTGKGVVTSPETGDSYAVSFTLFGALYIEDIRL